MASGKHKTITYSVAGKPIEVVYADTAAAQTLAVTDSVAASAVINAEFDVVVRIAASTPCYVAISSNPTAVDSQGMLLMPGYDHVPVPAGERVSVIKATGGNDGVLNITPAVLA